MATRYKKRPKCVIYSENRVNSSQLSSQQDYNLTQLNFYQKSPKGLDYIENLSEYAVQRLQTYKYLMFSKKNPEILPNLHKIELGSLTNYGRQIENLSDIRRIDDVSHWILRLAYCKTYNLRSQFLNLESIWFQLRYDSTDPNYILNLALKEDDLWLVDMAERQILSSSLEFKDCDYFKTSFRNVPDLLLKREYLLKSGYLYFPVSDLFSYYKLKFYKSLQKQIVFASKIIDNLEVEQIKALLSSLNLVQEEEVRVGRDRGVTLENLTEFSTQHFPICMRFMYDKLLETHHLKYFGRLQLGLFLKWIGLSLDDTLALFQREFTCQMSYQRFWKRYAYNFKHQYGTVGNRTNWQPYGCQKMIKQDVPAGRLHGCPFRHWDDKRLLEFLQKIDNLEQEQLDVLVDLQSRGEYQLACTKYFENGRDVKLSKIISSANEFFELSCKLEEFGEDADDIEDILDIFEDDNY